MKGTFDTIAKKFKSISLTEMNSQAAFLDRIDTKYLLTEKQLEEVLHDFFEHFYVLEIGGQSIFKYDSVYMDTEDYEFYKQHQNKEKSRTKVRTRLYVDSDLAFFEYKQKEKGVTRKFRYQFPSEEHGTMTKGKRRFFEGLYSSFYGTLPEKKISPALRSEYSRLTLCSKDSGERVTIDFKIKLSGLRDHNEKVKLNNVAIVESKSMSLDGVSHKIMEKHGIKKAKSCSKYCLGLIYNKINPYPGVFEKTIKTIEKMRNEK